jgi:lipopolysaccharide export system protein LptC
MERSMRKRTAHRWQLTLIMLVGVFVAVGSFWLVQVVNQAGQEEQGDKLPQRAGLHHRPLQLVRMNKEGKPAYIISGDKLTHRPVDDASDIDKPFVHSLSGEQPPMQMRAQTADRSGQYARPAQW